MPLLRKSHNRGGGKVDNLMRLDGGNFYRVIVRPVVIVTTISRNGVPNAAPFSFCTPISFDPPVFSIASQPAHDTWRNIKETEEFVINIPGENLGDSLKILSKRYPPEVNEIEEAGLTQVPSKMVAPPRIAEAYAWFECKMIENVEIGDHVLIAGEVLVAEIKEDMFDETLRLNKARPLCHIAGEFFTVPEEVKRIER